MIATGSNNIYFASTFIPRPLDLEPLTAWYFYRVVWLILSYCQLTMIIIFEFIGRHIPHRCMTPAFISVSLDTSATDFPNSVISFTISSLNSGVYVLLCLAIVDTSSFLVLLYQLNCVSIKPGIGQHANNQRYRFYEWYK